ncbi:MAG: D-aminoacyl-tRNA deacylase [Desulfomonilaceae bacterium]
MKAVVQRVIRSCVVVNGKPVANIGQGMLILLGAAKGDTQAGVNWLADKVAGLRIFSDPSGKMNLDISQINGEILVVSQFTLYGDCRKGKRPSYSLAATAETAEELYRDFISKLRRTGIPVQHGVFGAMMQVELTNDGPVTLIVETPPIDQSQTG